MTRIKQKVTNVFTSLMAKMYAMPTSVQSKMAKAFIVVATTFVAFPQRVFAADFISGAIDQLGIMIIAIGGGLAIWGIVNLLEGYGNDNPGAKSQGIKQLMAGGGLILIGIFVPGPLQGLFT